MDVKSEFLNGLLQDEVHVEQPPGFEDTTAWNRVYRLRKILYGLKQTPRAWYETLSQYLLDSRFKKDLVDKIFFKIQDGDHVLRVQIYVDDIIFGSTYKELYRKFSQLMQNKFEMSMMRELNFFLRLQVKQLDNGIFINQVKYTKNY